MITKHQIKIVVNQAELDFNQCWLFIAEMKNGKLLDIESISLIKFQPKLALTIFNLTGLYRKIEQEKKSRIRKKENYCKRWFISRMNFLANQQKLLNNVIAIGKGIGDSFAWFFYQRDRNYLVEHLRQQSHIHSPPGIGGIGELEFVKKVSVLNGYFVLYHGNTNILRLGDITLIDLKSLSVAGIGELKSQSLEIGKVKVSLLITIPNKDKKIKQAISSSPVNGIYEADIFSKLTPKENARFKRQFNKVSESYRSLRATSVQKLNIEMDSRFGDLENFVNNIKMEKFNYKQFGKSLLLIGYKEKKKSLYSNLVNKKSESISTKLVATNVQSHVSRLLNTDREDNAIVVGSIYYDNEGQTNYLLGMSHLAWWPVSSEVIRQLVFQEISIVTIFNPVHLISLLEKAGYTVKEARALNYEVYKKKGNCKFMLEGINYYLNAIRHYFLSEETIISLLCEVEGKTKKYRKNSTRIELQIEQKFSDIERSM